MFRLFRKRHQHEWVPVKRLITTSFEECAGCGALYYSSMFHDEVISREDRKKWPGW